MVRENCCNLNKGKNEENRFNISSKDLKEKYDYIILGWGAAAFSGAIKAQELGIKKILMIGYGLVGGTCVNVGCVPSKFLLNAGEFYKSSLNSSFEGISLKREKLDFKKLMSQKKKLVLSQRNQKYIDVLNSLKDVDVIEGIGKFISKNVVEVNGKQIKGEKFLIAVGSKPFIPKFEGINDIDYLTNIEALELEKLPKSMIILGSSTLALEFAQMFNNFGTKITIIQRGNKILSKFEPEISKIMKENLSNEGIKFFENSKLKKVSNINEEINLEIEINSKREIIKSEKILIATGRIPNSEKLGLENIEEITLNNKGAIFVNDYLQSGSKNISCAGDIIGEPMLETVAGYEGSLATINLFQNNNKKMDFINIPYGVFTNPQIAGVGFTENELKQKGIEYIVRILNLNLVPKNLIIDETKGFIKMIIDLKSLKILGCHMVGIHSTDIIQEVVLAKKYGLTIEEIIDSIHIFPSLSEAIKLVCVSFQKDLTKLSCCV